MDFIAANVLMPLSALLVSVFVGWRVAGRIPEAELSGLSIPARRILMFTLRYLCPIGICVVLILGLWQ
jgi:NSS family neurotransmitter:Na+ symporter